MPRYEEPAGPTISDQDRGVLTGIVTDHMVTDVSFAYDCFSAALSNEVVDGIRLTDDQLLAAAMRAHRAQRQAIERQPDLA